MHSGAKPTAPQRYERQTFEPDGSGCPMAHCSAWDDSFHDVAPLRTVSHSQMIDDPADPAPAYNNLGAYTGEEFAVCAYDSAQHPALKAFDYDGATRWTSPMDDLPARGRRRRVAGVLMAVRRHGSVSDRRRVFAANPGGFVAYGGDGETVWKRAARDIVAGGAATLGAPRCIRFDADGHLVSATTRGWAVKLDPTDGDLVDANPLVRSPDDTGRLLGGLITNKSSVVVGRHAYLITRPDTSHTRRPSADIDPVLLIRLALSAPDGSGARAIQPLEAPRLMGEHRSDRVVVGVHRFGGSPAGWEAPDGRVLVFANAGDPVGGGLRPAITCIHDDDGELVVQWRSVLHGLGADVIHAAPSVDRQHGTLLVGTRKGVYLYRHIGSLAGTVPPPPPIVASDLLVPDVRARVRVTRLGRPFSVVADTERGETVAYTGVHVVPRGGRRTYGLLTAVAFPNYGRTRAEPLWTEPLGQTPVGRPAPGRGTFGQPALFSYDEPRGGGTGIVVNTVVDGTFIFK